MLKAFTSQFYSREINISVCVFSLQLLKKLIVCGDTSCLRSLLAVAQQKDRALLQGHCHSAAKRILDGTREKGAVREAVAYLSIAIMASGGYSLVNAFLIFAISLLVIVDYISCDR